MSSKPSFYIAIILSITMLVIWALNNYMWQSTSKYLDLLFRSSNLIILLLVIYSFTSKLIPNMLRNVLKEESEGYYEVGVELKEAKETVSKLNKEEKHLDKSFKKIEKEKIEQTKKEAKDTEKEKRKAQEVWEDQQKIKAEHMLRQEIAKSELVLWQRILNEIIEEYEKNPELVDKKQIELMFAKIG